MKVDLCERKAGSLCKESAQIKIKYTDGGKFSWDVKIISKEQATHIYT
jgi:hypothetical protein